MRLSLIRRIGNKINGFPNVYIDENKFLIRQYLPRNPVILEAGACDGRDSLQMAVLWPKGQVHSMEPIPELFARTKAYVGQVNNVTLYPYALSDKCGQMEIHVSSGMSEGSSSLLEPKLHLEMHPDVKFEQTINVEGITIDDWAKRYSIKKVDLLWLDLQGAEHLALKGAAGVLKTVRCIYTEVNLIETYNSTMLYADLKKWLSTLGFEVALEDLAYKDQGNVLFVKREIFHR